MKRIRVHSDYHLFGPHALPAEGITWGPNDFYLGDNVDMTHVRPDALDEARAALGGYADLFEGRMVLGNHELNRPMWVPDFVKVSRTLLTHGDLLFWPLAKAVAYRNQPPAQNRYLHPGMFDFLKYIPQPIATKRFLNNCEIFARAYNVGMIVCGHRHPAKLTRIEHNGILIYVVPRGTTELEIL